MDDSETFLQFERVDVLAKEVRQRFSHRFQLGDVALQAPDLPFCDLRITHCYYIEIMPVSRMKLGRL